MCRGCRESVWVGVVGVGERGEESPGCYVCSAWALGVIGLDLPPHSVMSEMVSFAHIPQ